MINFKAMAFFDGRPIKNDIDKKAKKGLSHFGAVVRLTAKRSIRKSTKFKNRSRPGEPPKSHVGTLKKHIYYSWDAAARSVVVGPALFQPATGAPEVLEYGGVTQMYVARGKKKNVTVRKRPFMAPAMAKHQKNLPAYIAGSVK